MQIGGEGKIVEWAVQMRRFDENATLDKVAERGELDEALIDKLAAAVRRSHARAPCRDGSATTRSLAAYIDQNDDAFAERPDLFPEAQARRLTQDMRAAFAVARPSLIRRGAAGFARRCHGDLHLRNIALIEGEPVLFDAIEFSDAIASGDVLYDLAFLLMDLEARGLRRLGNRLFNRYLSPEPPESLAGLAALPLFLSLRAAIRAKVDAAGADRLEGARRDAALEDARRYFNLARSLLRYSAPRLVAVGGLSGPAKAPSPPSSLPGSAAPRARCGCAATWSASLSSALTSTPRRPLRPTRQKRQKQSTAASTRRRGKPYKPDRRSCSTRPSRPRRSGKPRPLSPPRSASPSTAFFSMRMSRPGFRACRDGGGTLLTRTPRLRANSAPTRSPSAAGAGLTQGEP